MIENALHFVLEAHASLRFASLHPFTCTRQPGSSGFVVRGDGGKLGESRQGSVKKNEKGSVKIAF